MKKNTKNQIADLNIIYKLKTYNKIYTKIYFLFCYFMFMSINKIKIIYLRNEPH